MVPSRNNGTKTIKNKHEQSKHGPASQLTSQMASQLCAPVTCVYIYILYPNPFPLAMCFFLPGVAFFFARSQCVLRAHTHTCSFQKRARQVSLSLSLILSLSLSLILDDRRTSFVFTMPRPKSNRIKSNPIFSNKIFSNQIPHIIIIMLENLLQQMHIAAAVAARAYTLQSADFPDPQDTFPSRIIACITKKKLANPCE